MANIEALHDLNEKSRREAEEIARGIIDDEERVRTLQLIAGFYETLYGMIERGVYSEKKIPKAVA